MIDWRRQPRITRRQEEEETLERRAEERPSKGRMGSYKQLEHLSINKDHCDEKTFAHLRSNHLFASPYFVHLNIKAPQETRAGIFTQNARPKAEAKSQQVLQKP